MKGLGEREIDESVSCGGCGDGVLDMSVLLVFYDVPTFDSGTR